MPYTREDTRKAEALYLRLDKAERAIEVLTQPNLIWDVYANGNSVLSNAPAGFISSIAIRTAITEHWKRELSFVKDELEALGFK